jgi:predicted NBD/HSP70 family sugar kinase
MHRRWTELLDQMSSGSSGSGVSSDMLGRVLIRVALASEPVPRSEISKGRMLPHPLVLASGTVGKAVDELTKRGLLTDEGASRRGQVGPPARPLSLGGPKWAIVGIHVDQQHDGPDHLTGVICGLNRQRLAGPESLEIPKNDGKHDLAGLAQGVRKLTETLLDQAAALPGRASDQELLGVGIELGGHVYHGKVIDSTHAQWGDEMDLVTPLRAELGKVSALKDVPVVVENDVNALAIHGYYGRSFTGNFVALVTVFQQGVGGALILDGRMYRGSHGMAPEPGHLAVEYPKAAGGRRPVAGAADKGSTFEDPCLCSTETRKMYGHVDALATPSRVQGEHAFRSAGGKVSLERIARAPRAVADGEEGHLLISDEAKILHRAGRALGRGLAQIVNIVNPGQIVLLLPEPLASPAPGSSGTDYLDGVETEIAQAYSTGPVDARGGQKHLTVRSYADEDIACQGAVAAATTVFNEFVEHARGYDVCAEQQDGEVMSSDAPRETGTRRTLA